MTSAEAILAPRSEQRIVPGLDRMKRVLDELGHPERRFVSVTVLGTNGKGSTAALLAAVLGAHRTRVGLYTSPHLVHVEERIRVAGADIARRRLVRRLHGLAGHGDLSYFEVLTVAAIVEFAERGVEVAVLEAGLGGRWDAVNAVDAPVALLTNIGLDHQAWLGPTRADIAAEKAAALRGRLAIVGAWDDEVEPVIRAAAAPHTRVSTASEWAEVTPLAQPRGIATPSATPPPSGQPAADDARSVGFRVAGVRGEAPLPLAGAHQFANLRLALAGAAALASLGLGPSLDGAAVGRGVGAVRWPGRLQWLRAAGRDVLVDGAHNREAALALAAALDAMNLSGRLHLVFSCLDDKPLAEMAAVLAPRAASIAVTALDSPRATPIARLGAAFPTAAVAADVRAALTGAPPGRPVVATGSLRTVGEVLRLAVENANAR